jgi:mono/diheme cytochrome c family protein
MITSWSVILKRLAVVFLAAAVALGVLLLFTYDVIKIDWISTMEIQPSFKPMDDPLPAPPLSIPVEGPAYIESLGAPKNPVAADQTSLARGKELYDINCRLCHGADGKGNGPVASFLQPRKPIDLTGPVVSSISDGAIFMVITNGMPGAMPPLNENLVVRERWDVVNYVRTLPQK